jgi:hypothetical protein
MASQGIRPIPYEKLEDIRRAGLILAPDIL